MIFFKSANKLTKIKRNNIIKVNKLHNLKNYYSFGYDYFDNKKIEIGYKGYFYDKRYLATVKKIIKHYKLKKGSKILDFGCAKGFILNEFKKEGMQIYGLDKSHYAKKMCVKAVKKNIKLYKGICSFKKYKDNFFDFIISKETLPHIEKKEIINILKQFIRISKNNKMLIVMQCPKLQNDIIKLKKFDPTHKTLLLKKDWIKMFNSLNLKNVVQFKNLF